MKYKKTIILLALVVFLLSIAGVSASEIDNTIASENANTIELSTDNDIEDNLQTSEENEALASTDYDEAIAQTDTEVLGADSATYSNLADEISRPGNITLTHKNYTYDKDATAITITEANKVIDGNGAVIDMNGSTIRAFYISASDVTIKNLTIKNANYNGNGGAIYFDSTGTLTNCNFTGNTATGDDSYGGAVYFWNQGTVTNCNFVDNKATGTASWGGAVYFSSTGSVSNCNFTNNTATSQGGAVYFKNTGNVTNCNFTGNSARYGGAVYFSRTGSVSNCNFTNNKATGTGIYDGGGAVYFNGKGDVTNCNFVENSAYRGGAIFSMGWYTTADTCIFKRNSGDNVNTVIYPPTLNVNNFTTVHGSGEKLTFDLKTNSSIPVTNGNISISVYFKDNGEWVRNYTCLSGEGWIPDLPVGSYIAFFDTEYAEFQKINRTVTITVPEHTFWFLNYTINGNDNPVIELSHDFYFDPAYDAAFVNGIVINRPVTIKGNGNAIDANRQARIFYVQSENAVLENLTLKNAHSNSEGGAVYFNGAGEVTNCNFTDNSARNGGAIYFYGGGSVSNCNFTNNKATGTNSWGGAVCFWNQGTVSNCNFINNKATGTNSWGGAVYFNSNGEVTNCNFTNNTASGSGGAVYFDSTGTVSNCNFTGNNATTGSAIYFDSTSATKTVSNSRFLNNRANAEALEITKNDNNITITFTGRNNLLNAIYSREDVEVAFYNVTYWGAKGITTISATMSGSNKEEGQNITVGVVVNNELVLNDVIITNENGTIVLNISAGENYYISARHDTDSYYTEAEKTISNNTKFNVNVTSQTTNNKTVNITAKSNIYSEVMPGKLLFVLPNGTEINATYGTNGTWWAVHKFDDYDVYQVNATYQGLDNVTITNGTISIFKTPTAITVENETLELLVDDSIATGATLTPADAGNVTYTVSNSSVVKVEDGIITAVGEGTAIITVSFAENEDYAAAENKTIKVTVIKYDSKVIISPIADVVYPNNVTITYTIENKTNVTVSIAGVANDKIIITNDTITVIGLDAGEYTITVINNESRIYHQSNDTKTFTVNKQATSITAADVSATYNINKDLVITLKDANGNPLTGASITVDLNGAKTYTTDSNGQVKVSTKGLAPNVYTAKVTFNGNTNYAKSTKDVKVTVKKATPKLTAKKKTFKTTTKTKKYTIVLKDNTGKAIKKAKIALKVKGKTYKATTNSKGKAVFKITKLNKKGTFKATITYKGNKYYNKVSKKANIKVIVTFKTVSKGSKDKSTVKEIQQALKDHGYYLSYKGHYLKVDGKFQSCTERSVKQFQKDKGLKVTGKVDEKTAKKLGLI